MPHLYNRQKNCLHSQRGRQFFYNLALLDLRLHDKPSGLEILEKIRADEMAINVIVCSNYAEKDIMVRTLMPGARAFVLKGAPSNITKTIRTVQQEGIFVTDYD